MAWRLLRDGAASGPWNMGVDEALLATARQTGRSSLRLYGWDGPWLSLGYGQRVPEGLPAACGRAGVGLVRRATGGSAVLHGADLTYTVAAPEAALPPGLRGSYGRIAEALLAALAALGLPARRAPQAPGERVFDCFERPGGDEICVGERKLVGSAQRRCGGAVLQHGSIRLAPDPPAAVEAGGLDPGRATSLAEEGQPRAGPALREALERAVERVLDVSLVPGSLSPAELRAAEERVRRHAADPLARAFLPADEPSRAPIVGR